MPQKNSKSMAPKCELFGIYLFTLVKLKWCCWHVDFVTKINRFRYWCLFFIESNSFVHHRISASLFWFQILFRRFLKTEVPRGDSDVGDWISMLVTYSECQCPTLMEKNSGCWLRKWPKPSPTHFFSNIRHQHRFNRSKIWNLSFENSSTGENSMFRISLFLHLQV